MAGQHEIDGRQRPYPVETANRWVNQLGPILLEFPDGDLRPIHELVGEYHQKSQTFLYPDSVLPRTRLGGAFPEIRSRRPRRDHPLGGVDPIGVEAFRTYAHLGMALRTLGTEARTPDGQWLTYTDEDFFHDWGYDPWDAQEWIEQTVRGLRLRTFDGSLPRERDPLAVRRREGRRSSVPFVSAEQILEAEQEQRRLGKGTILMAGIAGGTVAVVASACAPVTPSPQPTRIPTFTPEPPTPTPFSLLEATPTPGRTIYALPIRPPEFRRGYGGAFPESIREVANQASYRALEIQKRNEEGPFLVTEEEYYQTLDEFRERRGYEVLQRWNNDLTNFQMVTTLVRRNAGTSEVRWFVTQAGAFMARPDSLPEGADPKNPPQVWVPLPQGTKPEFAFGWDRHVYLFALDAETSQDVFWFNTTEANAFEEGGMEQGWKLHPSVEELAQSWSLNIARIAYQGGRWIGLDASGKAVIAFNREAQDWSVSEFVPTSCLDEEQNQEVINQFLEDYGYTSLEDAVSNVNTEFFRAGLSIVRNGGEFYRQMWYMGFDMKIIGGYAFSLEHRPGFNNGDIAVCLLSASPNLGSTVAPILLGLERHGTWSQANVLMVAGASQSVSGQRIDLPHLEDALAWIQASRNRVIDPLILLRFDRLNWEKDPSWHVGYEATLPLLKNPDGYIMRYTQNPTELGPRIKGIDGKPWGEGANLYRVISELNRDPGGDIGLFAWQITLLP